MPQVKRSAAPPPVDRSPASLGEGEHNDGNERASERPASAPRRTNTIESVRAMSYDCFGSFSFPVHLGAELTVTQPPQPIATCAQVEHKRVALIQSALRSRSSDRSVLQHLWSVLARRRSDQPKRADQLRGSMATYRIAARWAFPESALPGRLCARVSVDKVSALQCGCKCDCDDEHGDGNDDDARAAAV